MFDFDIEQSGTEIVLIETEQGSSFSRTIPNDLGLRFAVSNITLIFDSLSPDIAFSLGFRLAFFPFDGKATHRYNNRII